MNNRTCHKSSIGGSALIEGIMMRGPEKSAMAVRKPDHTIETENWTHSTARNHGTKKTLCARFSIYRQHERQLSLPDEIGRLGSYAEEEPEGFEKWLAEKLATALVPPSRHRHGLWGCFGDGALYGGAHRDYRILRQFGLAADGCRLQKRS